MLMLLNLDVLVISICQMRKISKQYLSLKLMLVNHLLLVIHQLHLVKPKADLRHKKGNNLIQLQLTDLKLQP